MTEGYWGTAKYGDGAPVPLRRERCTIRPRDVPGTHVCREHEKHEGVHRCICNIKWTEDGRVVK